MLFFFLFLLSSFTLLHPPANLPFATHLQYHQTRNLHTCLPHTFTLPAFSSMTITDAFLPHTFSPVLSSSYPAPFRPGMLPHSCFCIPYLTFAPASHLRTCLLTQEFNLDLVLTHFSLSNATLPHTCSYDKPSFPLHCASTFTATRNLARSFSPTQIISLLPLFFLLAFSYLQNLSLRITSPLCSSFTFYFWHSNI